TATVAHSSPRQDQCTLGQVGANVNQCCFRCFCRSCQRVSSFLTHRLESLCLFFCCWKSSFSCIVLATCFFFFLCCCSCLFSSCFGRSFLHLFFISAGEVRAWNCFLCCSSPGQDQDL